MSPAHLPAIAEAHGGVRFPRGLQKNRLEKKMNANKRSNETMSETQMYRGFATDRLLGESRAATRRYTTWEAAHHSIEALARRKGLMGDRYIIHVTED